MNSTQIKLNFKNLLALLLVVLFTSETTFAKRAAEGLADMAMESMAPPPPQQALPVSETVNFYSKKLRTQKLSENETNILNLSILAQDVFDIKDFMIYAHFKTEKEKIEAITLNYVAGVIQQAIEKKTKWDEPISTSNLEKLKENRELLKKTLNDSSYSWAWISYQNDQKQEAKTILAAKFENAYANVMKLRAVYNHDKSPMIESERISKILKPMSTIDENKAREDQLKNMRIHISGLPDYQIMT